MNRHLRTLLTGAAVVIPSVITLYVIWWIALTLDALGKWLLETQQRQLRPGVGAAIVLAALVGAIYLVGLLARLVFFRSLLGWWERIIGHVPGIKTLYESVRDLMHLFGGKGKGMGTVVEYRPPGSGYTILGVVTNQRLAGTSAATDENLVSLYLPFTYMIGGVTVLADRRAMRELDMSVERALKLAATAHVETACTVKATGGAPVPRQDAPAGPAPRQDDAVAAPGARPPGGEL